MDSTQTQTFAPDQMVEGKYRIKRLLAQGGMGAVYHAVQEPLGRDVAVKVLKPQDDTPAKREQREKRFFREAAVSGKLNHPNTIVILDYGKLTDQPGFFLVMEFLEGKSLRELLRERGSLGTRVTIHITMQIASSLADAHRNGAVHRDLKPPNVMLVPRGDDPYFVKVVDFGLVKQLEPDEGEEELTSENALVGSPMYMAPERFLSHNADSPAVDVYSLGIMMYEMLVGRPPFIRSSDSTLQHIMMQHIQDEPPRMHKFRPDLDLPPGFEELVMKCLAKRPEDRIQSMDSLLRLLRSCASSIGMSVPAPVEDTGAFVPPAEIKALRQSSDDLLPSDTGEATLATVEQPFAGVSPDASTSGPMHAYSGPLNAHSGQLPADISQQTAAAPKSKLGLLSLLFLVLLAVAGGAAYALFASQKIDTTRLVVNSVPSGATIWAEDLSIGATPFDGPIDVTDATTLRIEKEGFEPFHYRVPDAAGERVVIDARLVAIEKEPAVAPPEPTADEPEPAPEPEADSDTDAKPEQVEAKPKPKKPKPRPRDEKPSDPDIKLDR